MSIIIIEYMMTIIYIVKLTDVTMERPMKVSREQAARNRERVLAAAAKLFRERGFEGVGVADVMHGAGLTHGGFYGQFASKEELAAEAYARAIAETVTRWEKLADRPGGKPLSALMHAYLSARHRDDPGLGCLLSALGPEVARQSPAIRRSVTEGFRTLIDSLTGLIPGRSAAAKRKRALAVFSSLVGAMVLARAVDDPALSEEILQAMSASLAPAAS